MTEGDVPPRRLSHGREETRVARPPPLRTYYADWAEVILPEGHRFPMEKYQATRLMLEQDKSLSDIMELVPSPVRRGIRRSSVAQPRVLSNVARGVRPFRVPEPPINTISPRRPKSKHPQKASLIDVLAVHEEVT